MSHFFNYSFKRSILIKLPNSVVIGTEQQNRIKESIKGNEGKKPEIVLKPQRQRDRKREWEEVEKSASETEVAAVIGVRHKTSGCQSSFDVSRKFCSLFLS